MGDDSGKWPRVAAALIVAVGVGCRPEGEKSLDASGQSMPAGECEWLSAAGHADDNTALCDLKFREIVRLEGSIDGIAPNSPVLALWDGTYLTGTYTPGRLALWGPDGKVIDVHGTGAGEGPGEFDFASSLVQTSGDEFFVFTGHHLVHKYSISDGSLRSFRVQAVGGVAGAVLMEGGH